MSLGSWCLIAKIISMIHQRWVFLRKLLGAYTFLFG